MKTPIAPIARCSFPDCARPLECKGLCKAHYFQQRRGRPLKPIGEPHNRRAPGVVALRLTLTLPRARAKLLVRAAKARECSLSEWASEALEKALDCAICSSGETVR